MDTNYIKKGAYGMILGPLAGAAFHGSQYLNSDFANVCQQYGWDNSIPVALAAGGVIGGLAKIVKGLFK